jgi:hypothetical protein
MAAFALAASTLPTALGVHEAGSSAAGAFDVGVEADIGHLVVSEIATGGTSASDEFVEVYNPSASALPIEGLELIYVTASGATITRKALWSAGAPEIAPGAHLLVANEAGIFAAIADLTYANGLAATGGSMALRVLGASSAVDAVGWGTAASTWLEGSPIPAPMPGHSVERLPGGAAGSTQDTDQNAIDFVDREVPDPQNSASEPVPSGTPSPGPSGVGTPSPTISPTPTAIPTATPSPDVTEPPTPEPTPEPTAEPTPEPTPAPTAAVLTVAEARVLPDGSEATIEAVTLTDGSFVDGGGYLADETGGIAVLLSDGTFPRGVLLRATGIIDDRYHQRTLRASLADVTVLGAAADPEPVPTTTGSIGEPLEGRLVALGGEITSAASELSGGVAFDLDDGSGPIRVFVGDGTGIATEAWQRGAVIDLWGVVGQRDTSGTGSAGYRVQPRAAADILAFVPPSEETPTPSPSGTPEGSPSPSGSPTPGASQSPSPAPALVSIANARSADSGQRVRVRGVVTLPSGLTEPGSAVIQDASAGILIRLGDEAGPLARGELVELSGTRSTKAGMLSLRVTAAPLRLGQQAEPTPARLATGRLGEGHEALLVVVRGAIAGKVQRTSAGNSYFDLDDGSGPARVFLSPRAGVATEALVPGAWVEVAGVLGQDTTSQQPTRGYRIWPRAAADVSILAGPSANRGTASGGAGSSRGASTVTKERAGQAALGDSEAPELAIPRLARAVPTASAPQAVIGPLEVAGPEPDAGPNPAAAGLLLGGLLLLAATWLGLSPGLPERLRAAVLNRPEEGEDNGEDAARSDSRDGADPIGRLIPLTVLDGGPSDDVPQHASPRKGGRILPPT